MQFVYQMSSGFLFDQGELFVDQAKSKVTLYMRPELHKMLKLRAVQLEMKMSEYAEQILERYLLEFDSGLQPVCPICQSPAGQGSDEAVGSRLPVGKA